MRLTHFSFEYLQLITHMHCSVRKYVPPVKITQFKKAGVEYKIVKPFINFNFFFFSVGFNSDINPQRHQLSIAVDKNRFHIKIRDIQQYL